MMAASMVQNSRFSLLTIDDDDSDEAGNKSQKPNAKSNQAVTNAKKKSKKKKKNQQKADFEDLRNLAFGKSGKSKAGGNYHVVGASGDAPGATANNKQWEEWKKCDSEFTDDSYEKDLQQAMLMSKLEFEQIKSEPSKNGEETSGKGSKDRKKKKPKENKSSTMSLEEFNQRGLEPAEPEQEKSPPPPEADPTFFNKVDEDVHRMIRGEKMQEEYRKQYIVENVRSQKYHQELDQKDKEIARLRATVANVEDELKQVKKRNKQLCHILAQGEMKDKGEMVMHVEQLTQVKDELTEQVTELTADLEKERSKVHSLKIELDKFKGGKHAGK